MMPKSRKNLIRKVKYYEKVNWGIIGCGDVTEKKSGPAFNKIESSKLAAVMRRDPVKAKDYAQRHGVPKWYSNAEKLIADPEIDAVYVATPPGSHAEYAIMAAEAGKHVYVEKPMALNYKQCLKMIEAAEKAGVMLFVAYYRRCLPAFLMVKKFVESGVIGKPHLLNVRLYRSSSEKLLQSETLPWRFVPEISGGGLFVDLASHQLDYLDYLFGPIVSVKGFAANLSGQYPVEDTVCAAFSFESGVLGSGSWCFSIPAKKEKDEVEIIGIKGKINFSVFDFSPLLLQSETDVELIEFPRPEPIQEPLIRSVVDALLHGGECPSTGVTAARTTKVMETILKDYYKPLAFGDPAGGQTFEKV